MATSTNYGWSEPDNTSLVKNGAEAMRTLGNAIDTSLWNSGYGQAGKNKTINSAFQVWQRGTSVAVTANTYTYTADRWALFPSGLNLACTVSRQTVSDLTNLPFIQYCARVQRNSGQTGTAPVYFSNPFETINSIPYAGKTVTLSYYARAGANFSSASNVLGATVYTGTGTDQNAFSVAYTGGAVAGTASATLTTTWQRFTVSATIATSATEIVPYFSFSPVGTAGTNDYYEITGVQLEVSNSVATPFQTASGGSIQNEVAMCERYYFRLTAGTTNYNPLTHIGVASSSTDISLTLQPPTTMRTAPTINEYGSLSVYGGGTLGLGFLAVSTLTLIRATSGMLELSATVTGASTGLVYRLQPNNAAGYIGIGAEL